MLQELELFLSVLTVVIVIAYHLEPSATLLIISLALITLILLLFAFRPTRIP